jgi:hypothetical protein
MYKRSVFSFIVEPELDRSVVFVGCKKTKVMGDPDISINNDKSALLGSIENGAGLCEILSPEVTWGKEDLIDFQSPTDKASETTQTSDSSDLRHEQTIGLSLDPLLQKEWRLTSTPDVSPVHSSTPTNVTNLSDGFNPSITQISSMSSLSVSTFAYPNDDYLQ